MARDARRPWGAYGPRLCKTPITSKRQGRRRRSPREVAGLFNPAIDSFGWLVTPDRVAWLTTSWPASARDAGQQVRRDLELDREDLAAGPGPAPGDHEEHDEADNGQCADRPAQRQRRTGLVEYRQPRQGALPSALRAVDDEPDAIGAGCVERLHVQAPRVELARVADQGRDVLAGLDPGPVQHQGAGLAPAPAVGREAEVHRLPRPA